MLNRLHVEVLVQLHCWKMDLFLCGEEINMVNLVLEIIKVKIFLKGWSHWRMSNRSHVDLVTFLHRRKMDLCMYGEIMTMVNLVLEIIKGNNQDQTVPLRLESLPKNVKKIICGYHHTCALTEDGSVYVWGRNYFGQLGIGIILVNSVLKIGEIRVFL